MDRTVVFLTIVGMGAVTYLPRLLPLLILTRRFRAPGGGSGRALSTLIEAWLGYVPAAVLAAMLFPSLFIAEERTYLYLWAAIPTAWIAWKTRSLVGAVLAGVAVVALGRLLLA